MLLKLILAFVLVAQLCGMRHNALNLSGALSSIGQFLGNWRTCVRATKCPSLDVLSCGKKADGTTQSFKNPCVACQDPKITHAKLGKC